LSSAAKEEETVVMARSDRAVAEKDNAGLDDRYREEEIVNIIRDAIAGRHRHDLDRHRVHHHRRKGVVLDECPRPGRGVEEDDDDGAIPAEGGSERTSGRVFDDGWGGNATTNHLIVSDDDSGGRARRAASDNETTTTTTTTATTATMQLTMRQLTKRTMRRRWRR
jgi:hypothetical protein